jgi:hypothetical protein
LCSATPDRCLTAKPERPMRTGERAVCEPLYVNRSFNCKFSNSVARVG